MFPCYFARSLTALTFFLLLAPVWALHPQNAGPETFEIKFKLPPPAPLSPQEEAATFVLEPGFHAELVAAEPMVDSPIALSWDEQGRMFVCEMTAYMHDVEAAGEDQPLCKIAVLEDTDGDGKMDKRTVFADGLYMARAVLCLRSGALVAEPPNLWFMRDTDGDGKADTKELVDGNYGVANGQPEHMANSPTRFLDNWIYNANHPARYRWQDGKFLREAANANGQWGLSQDDYGRAFYDFNSDFLRGDLVPQQFYPRNPNYRGSAGLGVQVMADQSCWPSHPTPGVNRGYEEKQLREDGTLATCTATCGASIYRGGLFPSAYAANAFMPEASANFVKRVILSEQDGVVKARNAYEGKEFWTSTDERFRPCNSYTGPDGALYVTDMYRGVVQHKSYLSHYLIQNIKDRQLEQPVGRGRIWRVVPDGAKPVIKKVTGGPTELVAALQDENGWVRDTAQRLLVERGGQEAVPALNKLAASGSTRAKVHALWTLEGLGALSPEVITAAVQDAEVKVRCAAVYSAAGGVAAEAVAKLTNDPSVEVKAAVGFALSASPAMEAAMVQLLHTSGSETRVREAVLSGLQGRELELLASVLASPEAKTDADFDALAALSHAVLGERKLPRVQKLVELVAAQPENSELQRALLRGATAMGSKKGSTHTVKPLYFPAALPQMEALAATATGPTKALLKNFDERIAWPDKPGVPPPPVVTPLNAEEQALFAKGKEVYSTLCAACHQPTGLGMAGLAPPLAESEWVLGDPTVLPRVVLHGLSGPIKVDGQPYSLEMPPLGAALSDEQIAGVLTYVRREWENNADPITPAMVAELRETHKARTKAWSEEELLGPPKRKAKHQ